MHAHRLRLAARAALAPAVLEVPDQFFLLRIDRNCGLTAPPKAPDLLIEVLELPVSIRMLVPSRRFSLACRL